MIDSVLPTRRCTAVRQACVAPAIKVAGNQIGDVIMRALYNRDATRHPIIIRKAKNSESDAQAKPYSSGSRSKVPLRESR